MSFKKILAAIAAFTQFLFISCEIEEPTMPAWDLSLNLPIVKKNYTLLEVVDKNRSVLNYYQEGANKNLLYYSETNNINEIKIEEKLKVDGFSKTVSETIGTITIGSDSVSADIGFGWIGPGISPGMQVVVPPQNDKPVSANLDLIDEFLQVKFESGAIDLSITNHFPSPVSLTIKNLVLKNTLSGETVAQYNGSIAIPPKETRIVKAIPVATGIFVKNQLTLDCTVSTNGSGGSPITVPSHSFTVKAKFNDLNVTEATAKIPAQDPVIIENTITIDESTAQPNKFQNIKIERGTLNLKISNNLDIDAAATFTIYNLKTPQGATFNETRSIGRKQTINVFDNLSLKDYSFVSLNGLPTNSVSYKISIQTKLANDYRTIKSTDGFSGTVEFSQLYIKEFTGQLKPQPLDTERSSIALDVKDIQNKLQFQQINLKNPILQLRLRTSAQIEFGISGRLEAKNNAGQKAVLNLNSKTLNTTLFTPSDSILTFNTDSLSAFFKKFSSFPDSLIFYAGGALNPNYKTVSVKNTDNISGRSVIELPFDFGIANALLKDSVDIELSKDERDQFKNFNYIEAGVKITNGVPAQISFTGKLYDELNRFLTYFPPKYSDQDTVITINGASTDNNGNVVSKNEQTIKVKTLKADADKISKAKYMKIVLKLNTTRANNLPVRFRTNDDLKIHAFGSLNYRVKP